MALDVERHSVLFSQNYQIEEKATDFLEIFFQKYMNNFTELFQAKIMLVDTHFVSKTVTQRNTVLIV